jgi:DNA-binding NarL/FixJ family response regulator
LLRVGLGRAGPGLCATLVALLDAAGPDALTQISPDDAGAALSGRELEVLYGICRGRSNLQIGRELFLAEQTVKVYVRSLFRKLGVQHRAQAVAYGFRAGLIN